MKTHGPASPRTTARPDPGVFDSSKFWGHTLTGPTATDQPENFEARVEQAWAYMKGAYFAAEEHWRLREVLVEKVLHERCGNKVR